MEHSTAAERGAEPATSTAARAGLLERAAEAAGLALYALELGADGGERVLAANAAYAALASDAQVHPDDAAAVEALRTPERLVALDGEVVAQRYRLVRPDGDVVRVEDRARVTALPDGGARLDGALVDVSAEERLGRELAAVRDQAAALAAEFAELGRTDLRTGLPSRRCLADELERRLADPSVRARLALLVVDVDRFAALNDAHGHAVGDEVLLVLGQRLARVLRGRRDGRPADLVGRWGGDELVVLLDADGGERAVGAAAERLRRAASAHPVGTAGAGAVPVSVAVGGVLAAPVPALGLEGLVAAAEGALAEAKRGGGDQVVLRREGEAATGAATDALVTARAIAVAATAREGVAEHHPQEVADLAAAIAERLGLDEAPSRRTLLAAWLHDVGKTAIPDGVLRKPGPLDADEWSVMRRHAEIGAQIARRAGLDEAADGILHHHERWDGTGYPAGLAGEEIPIEARIVAAADAYAAITSDRAHRPARTHGDAVRELERSAGGQLDPAVADAAVAVLAGRERPRPWADRA